MNYFYPRSPCGERRRAVVDVGTIQRFLSTLSLRRATTIHDTKIDKHNDFYPRSPCGERLRPTEVPQYHILISIHALLAESDSFGLSCADTVPYFYPRSPCGERRILSILTIGFLAFLSTLSLRRATPRGGKLLS